MRRSHPGMQRAVRSPAVHVVRCGRPDRGSRRLPGDTGRRQHAPCGGFPPGAGPHRGQTRIGWMQIAAQGENLVGVPRFACADVAGVPILSGAGTGPRDGQGAVAERIVDASLTHAAPIPGPFPSARKIAARPALHLGLERDALTAAGCLAAPSGRMGRFPCAPVPGRGRGRGGDARASGRDGPHVPHPPGRTSPARRAMPRPRRSRLPTASGP